MACMKIANFGQIILSHLECGLQTKANRFQGSAEGMSAINFAKIHKIVIEIPYIQKLITPYMVIGGLGFYLDSSSVFFFHQLPCELPEQNSSKTSHNLGSECSSKMHIWNLGYPLRLKLGGPIPSSVKTLQLGKFNGLYLRNQKWYTLWTEKTHTKMFLSYLPQNPVDSDKI